MMPTTPVMSKSRKSRLGTPPIYKEIGERIKKERIALKLTQEDLAFLIGQHRPSITLIELGQQKVAVHELLAIAEALGVPISCLLPKEM
jgi:transcriptional regulator with XRE-family HTH domain